MRRHCLRCGHGLHATSFIHVNSVPFLSVWYCRFKNEVILPSYEELDSSGNDLFTSWVKMSDHEILVQHMVDIEMILAEFREASERKHATSSHTNSSSKRFATRSIVQRRLSIYNWNPWTPSGERRCLRTTNCRRAACRYPAGGVRIC